jgi:hypothetical protein
MCYNVYRKEKKEVANMAKSVKTMKTEKKNEYIEKITKFLLENEEDVVRTGSGELAFPIVLENGDECFITLKIAIPTGTRDGEDYNGYAVAKSYKIDCENNAQKAENARKAKEKKIAAAKKRRENSAKIKAEREKRKEG